MPPSRPYDREGRYSRFLTTPSGAERQRGQKFPGINVANIDTNPNVDRYLRQLPPRSQELINLVRNSQNYREARLGETEIRINLNTNEPVLVVSLGDIHYGSLATDMERLLEDLATYYSDPEHIKLILTGDLIESYNPQYFRTNVLETVADIAEQEEGIIDLLKPLADKGQIIGLVGHYFAHEGWAAVMGYNIWKKIADGLNKGRPTRSHIKVLQQGCNVITSFRNGQTTTFNVGHIPEGKGKVDPLHGLHEAAKGYDVRNRPDVVFRAHTHNAATAVRRESDGYTTSKIILVLNGTYKTKDDYLGQLANMGNVAIPGQGAVIAKNRRGANPEKRSYGIDSTADGQIILSALKLLDRTEAAGTTSQHLGEIYNNRRIGGQPIVEFDENKSRKSKAPHKEDGLDNEDSTYRDILENKGYGIQHNTVVYKIDSELPILVQFLANTRFGSNSAADTRAIRREVITKIKDNPYKFLLLLRNLIDESVPKQQNRDVILKTVADLFSPIQKQILALMLDGNLRSDGWKSKKIGSGPVPAGSVLAQLLDTPLVENRSRLVTAIHSPQSDPDGVQEYTGLLFDHLEGRGSGDHPTKGLQSIYRSTTPVKPGYMVGGHMPLAGNAVTQDGHNLETLYPKFIATGWLSPAGNKDNVRPGAQAGAGLIMMPNEYRAFPVSSYEEADYLFAAMTMLVGLHKLGQYDRVMKKTPRR